MRQRIILIALGLALLALIVGLWLSRYTSPEPVGSRNGPTEVVQSKAAKVPPATTEFPPEKRVLPVRPDLEVGKPEVTYSDLSLEEANTALQKLIGEGMPSSTRMIRPGHLEMAPSDAKSLIAKIEAQRRDEVERRVVLDGVIMHSQWEELSMSLIQQPRKPGYGLQVEVPAGTVAFTLVPSWHGATIPRYNLWVDAASGLCLFNSISNYDP